jgi:dipeptidase D
MKSKLHVFKASLWDSTSYFSTFTMNLCKSKIMSEAVRNLEPKALWNYFADLNAIPRASKKEERVIAFAKAFGEELGFETIVDDAGNVIIRKPASPGMEDRTPIVIQSHLDMVHQKNSNVDFDFDSEGIRMEVNGDWVKANGTTLGADNGIGVASIMAILASKDIEHPQMDALFTIDEETGMTGALELKGGVLNGKILLNLDTEDDDELTIGCAGGIDVSAYGTYSEEKTPSDLRFYKLSITGLSGGHSGVEIQKGLANANKFMNRALYEIADKVSIYVHSVDGGGLRNAIPRESHTHLAIEAGQESILIDLVKKLNDTFKSECASLDPGMKMELSSAAPFETSMKRDDLQKLIWAIYACPNGIYRMSADIEDLVQTSNNLARVLIKNGKFEILCLTRSSVDTEKQDMMNKISSCFKLVGAQMSFSGNYPGWEPKPKAEIIKVMQSLYRKNFDSEIHVAAIHAGLECGIIGTNYPHMEMVSFGPNIRGAHSPDEKVQISSVHKYWKYLLDVLKNIPKQVN